MNIKTSDAQVKGDIYFRTLKLIQYASRNRSGGIYLLERLSEGSLHLTSCVRGSFETLAFLYPHDLIGDVKLGIESDHELLLSALRKEGWNLRHVNGLLVGWGHVSTY